MHGCSFYTIKVNLYDGMHFHPFKDDRDFIYFLIDSRIRLTTRCDLDDGVFEEFMKSPSYTHVEGRVPDILWLFLHLSFFLINQRLTALEQIQSLTEMVVIDVEVGQRYAI
jgi:hypothetical protein